MTNCPPPPPTQLSGMVCFIVGFVYAWLYLPGAGKGDPTGGKVGMTHLYLGTIVMGLAGMQVWITGGECLSAESLLLFSIHGTNPSLE